MRLPTKHIHHHRNKIMAGAKPLQPLNFGATTYETKHLVSEEDLTVVALKSNSGDTNYSYKAQSFQADFYSVVGRKDGDNLWFVGCSVPGNIGMAFDIEFKEKKGEKWENDKVKADTACQKWYGTPGGLTQPTVILATGIESMEIVASISAEMKCVMVDKSLPQKKQHHIKFSSPDLKKEITDKLTALCVYWLSGCETNPTEPWKKPGCEDILSLSAFLSEHGMFYVPVFSRETESSVSYTYGAHPLSGGGTTGYNLPPIKGTATYPIEGLAIGLPEVKTRGNSSWGSKGETTFEKIAARSRYLLVSYGMASDESLAELYKKVNESKESKQYFEFLVQVMGS